eukprot:SAG31_NODE_4128_length_3557_cov_1.191440_1_plen_84_part_10
MNTCRLTGVLQVAVCDEPCRWISAVAVLASSPPPTAAVVPPRLVAGGHWLVEPRGGSARRGSARRRLSEFRSKDYCSAGEKNPT